MGTARSHTADCRYRVCPSCMRPCWQTGHTAPGSVAATADWLAGQAHGLYPDWGAQGLTEARAALDQFLLPHAVRQEAEVPDPLEAMRWDVQHQPAQEFHGLECQG